MSEAVACSSAASFCGEEFVTLTDASSSMGAKTPTAFPTRDLTGVKDALARSIEDPDTAHQALPDPVSVTVP